MSVAPSTIQTAQISAPAMASTRKEMTSIPPAPFSPSTWNYLYYACIVASVLVGLGTILNGGAWQDAVLRMFVALLGGSLLAILFLTFVIIPLHVGRYEKMVEAQKAAIIAARDKAIQKASAANAELDQLAGNDPSFTSVAAQEDVQADASQAPAPEPVHDDQATSLRRMAASART